MKKNKTRNKSGSIFLVIFVTILLVAYFTNPKEEIHKERLKIRFTEVIDEIMLERQDDGIVYSAWKLVGSQLVETFVDNNITVDNYYLFTLTRLHWNGESYIAGIGCFGKVYITKQLNRELAEKMIDNMENKVIDSLPHFLK